MSNNLMSNNKMRNTPKKRQIMEYNAKMWLTDRCPQCGTRLVLLEKMCSNCKTAVKIEFNVAQMVRNLNEYLELLHEGHSILNGSKILEENLKEFPEWSSYLESRIILLLLSELCNTSFPNLILQVEELARLLPTAQKSLNQGIDVLKEKLGKLKLDLRHFKGDTVEYPLLSTFHDYEIAREKYESAKRIVKKAPKTDFHPSSPELQIPALDFQLNRSLRAYNTIQNAHELRSYLDTQQRTFDQLSPEKITPKLRRMRDESTILSALIKDLFNIVYFENGPKLIEPTI
jgi:hypothetical protein